MASDIPPSRGTSNPVRRTADLRRGRISEPGSTYFVTFATLHRLPALQSASALRAAHAACARLVDDHDVAELCATIMPEHVHLCFRLGERLSVDRVVAKWRTKVRQGLPTLRWQANFFEHRVRSNEKRERYDWYIFMNPYHAGLVPLDQTWSGWWCSEGAAAGLLAKALPGPLPQPAWLSLLKSQLPHLVLGE